MGSELAPAFILFIYLFIYLFLQIHNKQICVSNLPWCAALEWSPFPRLMLRIFLDSPFFACHTSLPARACAFLHVMNRVRGKVGVRLPGFVKETRHKHAPFLNNDHPESSVSLGLQQFQDQDTSWDCAANQAANEATSQRTLRKRHSAKKGRDLLTNPTRARNWQKQHAVMKVRRIALLGGVLLLACAVSAQQVSSGNNATSGSGSGSGSGYGSKNFFLRHYWSMTDLV